MYLSDERAYDRTEKTFEGDVLSQITDVINNAKLTKNKSVQDAPEKSPLGKITINDNEEVLYYYREGDETYLEKPYEGVYESNEDIDIFLSGLK